MIPRCSWNRSESCDRAPLANGPPPLHPFAEDCSARAVRRANGGTQRGEATMFLVLCNRLVSIAGAEEPGGMGSDVPGLMERFGGKMGHGMSWGPKQKGELLQERRGPFFLPPPGHDQCLGRLHSELGQTTELDWIGPTGLRCLEGIGQMWRKEDARLRSMRSL